MPEKFSNEVISFWASNALLASFFVFIRSFIKQEFRNPWTMIATSVISAGVALITGYMIDLGGGSEFFARVGVAVAALLSYDILRALLNFGEKMDAQFVWSILRSYLPGKKPDLPEDLPVEGPPKEN